MRWAILLGLAAPVGLLLGMTLPVTIDAGDGGIGASPNVPRWEHASIRTAAALGRLAAIDGDLRRYAAEEAALLAGGEAAPPVAQMMPPPAIEQAAVAAPPPPVDVAAALGGDLSAVLRTPRGPELVLLDGGSARRRVAPGGAYRDGWTLRAVEGQTIVLARGREVRRVPIGMGPPEPVALAAAPAPDVRVAGPPRGLTTAATTTSISGPVPGPARPRRQLRRPGAS